MRLSSTDLNALSPNVARFAYDREAQAAGIVHFGIGAFHRAHQAWYTDRAMDAGGRDWAIIGVSLRSAGVANQLNPQDGLYTVTERSGTGSDTRLVGAIREVIVAPDEPNRVASALASPDARIVTFTVTEKGYCRAADGSLDSGLAQGPSIYPHLARAFRDRRDAGLPGLTLLSCDNLAGNGEQLQRLMREYLASKSPDLVDWFETECTCPSSMVDRIVPATTDADRDAVAEAIGMDDDAAVVTEPFSQWVIEDNFAGPRPDWAAVGAQLVADVEPFETAKLRMLNGAHSALAYLGLEAGHDFVHEAVADSSIRPIVEQLMRAEAAPTIAAAPGQDLDAYADALLARFENPALQHRLAQIAMDGSQKIPQRWLATLADQQRRGSDCPAILTALAAWMRHVRGDGIAVDDPMADKLASTWQTVAADQMADALFGATGLLSSDWTPTRSDREALLAARSD